MTQSKKDLIKMIVWVSICMLAIFAIATYSHCTHQEEKETTEYQMDEARMKAKELHLKTTEDSVHFYEDGM